MGSNEKYRVQPLKTAKAVTAGVAVCALVGLLCFFGGRFSAKDDPVPPPDPIVLESQLTEIAELATVSYHYTNMAQFENSNDFYGVKIPFTTKRFILSYDGEIKAGVDLGRATVEVREKTVHVALPAAEILSHEIDADSVEVFDEKTSIFNPLHVTEFADFQADQQEAMEEKVLSTGLLSEAGEKAKNSVRALLVPVLPEGYHLNLV